MTVDDMIAALTLTIDHSDGSTWVLGTASRGDQVPVPQLIADLQGANQDNTAAAGRLTAAQAAALSASSQYTTDHATWVSNQTTAFAAWDRGLRALETLILVASPGAPVDPTIHITTVDIPGAKQRSDSSRVLARSLNVSAEAVRGEHSDRETYFNSLQGEPQPDGQAARNSEIAASRADATADGLSRTMARAQKYLDYLAVT